jgi:hypothetical protein
VRWKVWLGQVKMSLIMRFCNQKYALSWFKIETCQRQSQVVKTLINLNMLAHRWQVKFRKRFHSQQWINRSKIIRKKNQRKRTRKNPSQLLLVEILGLVGKLKSNILSMAQVQLLLGQINRIALEKECLRKICGPTSSGCIRKCKTKKLRLTAFLSLRPRKNTYKWRLLLLTIVHRYLPYVQM